MTLLYNNKRDVSDHSVRSQCPITVSDHSIIVWIVVIISVNLVFVSVSNTANRYMSVFPRSLLVIMYCYRHM